MKIGRRFGALLLAVLVATAFAATPAAAQEVDLGPSVADFTNEDGEFDQAGYVTALFEFAAAPSVAKGSTITVSVSGCTDGAEITVELVGADPAVLGESTDTADTYSIALPADLEDGFHIIRVTCIAPADDSLAQDAALVDSDDSRKQIFDIVIDVVAADSGSAVTNLVADFSGSDDTLAAAAQTGDQLSVTGRESQIWIGAAAALLLVGFALVAGTRRIRLES